MSTPGPTPGPLTVAKGIGREKTLHTLVDELGEVALVYGATTAHSEEVAHEIAHRYNTYPDILEALRGLLAMMKYENKAGFVVLHHPGVTAESVRVNLRTVIAKATEGKA